MNSRCWPRTVNVSPRTSRNAHPPFLQAFEGTPGRLPPGGLFYACGIQKGWLFRCSVLRIGDAGQWWCLPGPLKPSLAAVSLAIPGQTAPSRHHHCPAHFAAAPPPVPKPPEPFYEARFVGACLASERPALPAGRIPERLLALKLEKSLASCGATFAGSFAPFRGHGPLPLSQDDIGFPGSASLVSFFAILTSPRRPKSGHPVFIEENLCPPRRARVFFWKAFGLPQAGAFNP